MTGGNSKFREEMREISREAVFQINCFLWTITRFGKDYRKKDPIGCANCSTEGEDKHKNLSNCTKRENSPTHLGLHGLKNIKGQLMRKIKRLKVGY